MINSTINSNYLATAEYLRALLEDDGEAVVALVLDQVLERTQTIIFEKHISSLVVPYAVQFAKQGIQSILKWEYFADDFCDPLSRIYTKDNGIYY